MCGTNVSGRACLRDRGKDKTSYPIAEGGIISLTSTEVTNFATEKHERCKIVPIAKLSYRAEVFAVGADSIYVGILSEV